MARTKGRTTDTRAALLRAAWALFQLEGYDTVPVDAIVRRAGLSKGTFFHYFPTKIDLLEAVCEHVSAPAWAALSARLASRRRRAVARLNLLLSGMRTWRVDHLGALVGLYRALAREENTLLRLKLAARQDELLGAALLGIVEQGVREGAFSVADIEETVPLVCAVVARAGEANLRQLVAAGPDAGDGLALALERRAEAAASAVERLLGARAGVVERVRRSTFRRMRGDLAAARP